MIEKLNISKKALIYFLYCLIFILFFFTENAVLMACNFNGACESGENKDNCVFDCVVSKNTKEVKIAACSYGISKITRFNLNGSQAIIADGQEILNFLTNKEYIDLNIGGDLFVNGSSKKLSGYTNEIPILIYWLGIGLQPSYCNYPDRNEYPICQLAENGSHEDWFLHKYNFSPKKENRIQLHYYGSYIWNSANSDWRNAFTDAIQTYHNSNPNIDGIFFDNTQVRINTGLLVTNHTEDQVVKAGIDKNGDTYKYLTTNYPTCIYTGEGNPLNVIDKNNPAKTYKVAPWPGTKNVYFEKEVAGGTQVVVNYFSQATVDPNVLNNWEQNYALMLQETRQKVGGKLIIFNGFYGNYNHDRFFQYADGGMKEGVFGYNVSEASWKEQLDQLVNYSTKKIYYALTYSSETPSDQMQKHALFSFASYLLGKEKYAYFQYAPSCQHFYWFDYWKTPLGNPMEHYHLKGNFNGANVYEREYEKALVLVNPSDTNSGTINLGKTLKTLNGSSVSSISLSAKEGILLQNSK